MVKFEGDQKQSAGFVALVISVYISNGLINHLLNPLSGPVEIVTLPAEIAGFLEKTSTLFTTL
jgi:hypothetical protein